MKKVISVGRILRDCMEVKVDTDHVAEAELMQERFAANIELSRMADAKVEIEDVESQSTIDDAITDRMFAMIHKNHLKNKQY